MTVPKRSTIIDVAKEANVAVGTVSRYLNDHNVRPGTRQRLEEAIRKLDFRTNPIARAMKSSKTKTLGFVLPTFDGYYSKIMKHLVEAFRRMGYTILIFSHAYEPDSMRDAVMAAADRRIDGLLFSGNDSGRDVLRTLMGTGVPVVIFNNDIKGLDVDKVLVRDRAASAAAVGELIALGHERIGIAVGDPSAQTAVSRRRGYRDALKAAGVPHDPELEFGDNWERETGSEATRRFLGLQRPATAIFYSNNRLGRGGLDYHNAAGLRPGDAAAVVSFDDHEVFQTYQPGIAAVAQPVAQIAAEVASLMATRLSGEAPAKARTVHLDASLVRRPSLTPRRLKRA